MNKLFLKVDSLCIMNIKCLPLSTVDNQTVICIYLSRLETFCSKFFSKAEGLEKYIDKVYYGKGPTVF